MSNPYQLVVFDWEGTIADTLGNVLHVIAEEAKIHGFGEIDPYQAKDYVSLGLKQSLRKLFPHINDDQHEQLFQSVQQSMILKPTEIRLIPGAKEFIQQLVAARVDVAVATNKGHHSLLRALHMVGLDEIFKVTRSASQVPPKPCPQMLEEIIEELGATPESTIMIGDSVTDIEMANSINVKSIGVDFYHQQEAQLLAAGAAAVFDNYQLLSAYLKATKE